MDGAGTTRWASILKDGDFDTEEVADAHGLFGAFNILFGVVLARFTKDSIIHDLARFSRNRESTFDFRAERNDIIMSFEFFDEREWVAISIESGFLATKAGAYKNLFHTLVSLFRLVLLCITQSAVNYKLFYNWAQ